MQMSGADATALRATGDRFVAASQLLGRRRVELTALFGSAPWTGPDAEMSRVEWNRGSAPAIARTGLFLEELGTSLLRHAADQERASGASPRHGYAGPVVDRGPIGDVVDVVGDAVREAVDGVATGAESVVAEVGALLGDWLGGIGLGGVEAGGRAEGGPVVGLRPETFGDPGDGRAAVVAAMTGFADEGRIGRDEIEIRALDNGRYVVVLPGVTDLSAGFDRFAREIREHGVLGVPVGGREAYETWADNDEPTVRKMRYAFDAAVRDDTDENEYSTAVIAAMEGAGVPSGADVMLVGHSFGAYTAVDLAVEPTFNSLAGADDGYRVNVTHVVAAGAETDWRFDELPASTRTLVLNNRWDAVYQAENLLHRNATPTEPGHLEAEFFGGGAGYGHDEHNYLDWMGGTDDRDVERWLVGAGALYAAGGTRVSVRVPDPALDDG